ncbi:MAG: ATP-binding protein, partial [Saprospiraceae bacterium]
EISSYVIDGMIEDSSHNLWIKSSSAFIKLNPLTKETFIYSTNAGITRASMTWLRFYVTHGKQILLGHDKGFYQFHPDSLAIKTNFKLMLTELFINTIAIFPGVGSQIKKPVEEINDLVLKYNENNIYLNFTAVDYREPETIKYFFKLEGYDREWQEVRDKKDKSSYYFNLPPGAYTYKLKAFNNDGTKAEKTLKIHIYPPWWRTWWAYSIYILLLVGGIWTYVNRRTHTLEKEKIVLEQKVMERTRELKDEKEIVESTLLKLKATQTQLIHSEKMASLGELTAGIAHEIQNPLNFVNNFSEINSELAEEAGDEMDKGNYSEGKNILKLIKENERKINHHGKRADAIVKAMLQHSQSSTSQAELTDINKLAGEYLHLAYEDLKIKGFQDNANKTLSGGEPEKAIATTFIPITIGTDFDPEIGSILVIPKDMVRVLLNLYSNAFYTVQQKALKIKSAVQKSAIPDLSYEPTITVSTKKEGDHVLISVKDNGEGIPEKIIDKIFQPFFTTKPTGQGTGLGLSLAYDIIKSHGGSVEVESQEGLGSEFIIKLPI